MSSRSPASLRAQVVRGGAYLAVRQTLAILIGVVGLLVLTRLIGPKDYGRYAGSLAIVVLLANVGQFGIHVYLIRREQAPARVYYDQAFTCLAGIAGVLSLGVWAVSPLVEKLTPGAGFAAPLRALSLTVPLTLLSFVPLAILERELNYRAVAILELGSQVTFYACAIALAVAGSGMWAPVAGYFVSQTWLIAGSYAVTRLRPRFVWSIAIVKDMLGYGLSYSASTWIWMFRMLVNPIVVGHYGGAAAVGNVALAIRLVDALSFAKDVTWRLSIPVLARMQRDYVRLRNAVEEAMGLQVLAVALPLGLGAAVIWLLPHLQGDQWETAARVYPMVALGALVNAVFTMHSSTLYVMRKNVRVAWFHVVHLGVFAGSAIVLVRAFGTIGYGLAELAAISTYIVLHVQLRRVIRISYSRALTRFVVLSPALLAPLLPPPWGLMLLAPALGLFLSPRERRELRGYVRQLQSKPA